VNANQLTVNTGTCSSEKRNVAWIKNEVIAKGFTPISFAPMYMTTNYHQAKSVPIDANFVIWGEFKPRVFWKSYTCPRVMLAMETTWYYNHWWFITNTTEKRCTSIYKGQVTVACTDDATGQPVLLKVKANFGQTTKSVNSFMVDVCE